MMSDSPLILWFRRDLRLSDAPMLAQAAASGRPLIPVFILDPETEALGAAAKWRLGLALAAFAQALAALGARLVLRRGAACRCCRRCWPRPGRTACSGRGPMIRQSKARDTAVKAALRGQGVQAVSHPGALLHEPWQVATGQGGPYRVYTPFWNAVRGRGCAAACAGAEALRGPEVWPACEALADWAAWGRR